MSIPTNSIGPTPPTGTSNPVKLEGWLTQIINWIKGLSPAGVTEYDSGPVALSLATGWSGTSFSVRRVGRVVYLMGEIWGGTLDATVVTLDPQFRPASRLAVEVRRFGGVATPGKLTIDTNGALVIREYNGSAGSPGLSMGTVSWMVP